MPDREGGGLAIPTFRKKRQLTSISKILGARRKYREQFNITHQQVIVYPIK